MTESLSNAPSQDDKISLSGGVSIPRWLYEKILSAIRKHGPTKEAARKSGASQTRVVKVDVAEKSKQRALERREKDKS